DALPIFDGDRAPPAEAILPARRRRGSGDWVVEGASMPRRRGAGRHVLARLLVVALLASLLPAARPGAVALAADPPGLGGQLFSTGQPVEGEVRPAHAGSTSQPCPVAPAPARFLAHRRGGG